MARFPLVLLHHSGGSAQVFERLLRALPPQVEPFSLELPGRGRRWREHPVTSAQEAVDDLAAQIDKAGISGEFSIFGHSMGAYLGLALAVSLETTADGTRCGTLFASANAGPAAAVPIFRGDPREARDDEILDAAAQFGGLSPQILAHEQLRERTASLLRADFCVCDSFVHTLRHSVIESRIVACYGMADIFTAEQIYQWHRSTTADMKPVAFPGDHFYLNSQADAVAAMVGTSLGEVSTELT